MGMLLAPILLLVLVVAILVGSIVNTVSIVAQGGLIEYDEEKMQSYALAEYEKAFGEEEHEAFYEDNLLILITTYEEYDGYECFAMVGNNLDPEINEMMGAEGTTFYNIVTNAINRENYKNSMTGNLRIMLSKLSRAIQNLNLDSSFDSHKDVDRSDKFESRVVNYTDLTIEADPDSALDNTLQEFTEETGIPIVIVVQTGEAVFGKHIPMINIIILVASSVGAIVLTYIVIRNVIRRKRGQTKEKIRL